MKRFIGIGILLLLVAGGVIWFLWPRSSGILFAYVPKDASLVVSIHTSEVAKLAAKEKLQNKDSFNQVLQKMEAQWGIDMEANRGKQRGINMWEPPLFVLLPRQNLRAAVLALRDSASFSRSYRDGDDGRVKKGEGFSFVYIEESRRLVAWNEEVVIALWSGSEDQLLKHMPSFFGLEENELLASTYPELKDISRKKSELTAWMKPEFLGLQDDFSESSMASLRFEKGQMNLHLEVKSTYAPQFSSLDLTFPNRGMLKKPFEAKLSISPDVLRKAMGTRFEEGYASDLLRLLTGRVAFALTGTGTFEKEILTYDYDENFNRVEVKKTVSSERMLGVGLLEIDEAGRMEVLLDEWKEKNLLQAKGDRLQLLDVFEQDLFVDTKEGMGVEALKLYSDTINPYWDKFMAYDSVGGKDPQQWIQLEGRKEFFKLAGESLKEGPMKNVMESAYRMNISFKGEGRVEEDKILLDMAFEGPDNDNFALTLLSILLEAVPESPI